MDLAASLASDADSAPDTRTSISLVAPSPSLAIAFASSTQTAVRACSKLCASGVPSTIGGLLALPFAKRIRLSLVLLSPSTLIIWLSSPCIAT